MLRFGLLFSTVVFALDQLAKYWILVPMGFAPTGWWANPAPGTNPCLETGDGCRVIEIWPVFNLQMVWNHGVSFGLLRADQDMSRWALVALSFLISAVFFWWLRTAERRLTAAALGLVIGGALGNVIDRVRFGAVCDFLDFHGLWFPWVFNVADASITLGAVLLAIDMVFFGETEPGKGSPWSQVKGMLAGPANKG